MSTKNSIGWFYFLRYIQHILRWCEKCQIVILICWMLIAWNRYQKFWLLFVWKRKGDDDVFFSLYDRKCIKELPVIVICVTLSGIWFWGWSFQEISHPKPNWLQFELYIINYQLIADAMLCDLTHSKKFYQSSKASNNCWCQKTHNSFYPSFFSYCSFYTLDVILLHHLVLIQLHLIILHFFHHHY